MKLHHILGRAGVSLVTAMVLSLSAGPALAETVVIDFQDVSPVDTHWLSFDGSNPTDVYPLGSTGETATFQADRFYLNVNISVPKGGGDNWIEIFDDGVGGPSSIFFSTNVIVPSFDLFNGDANYGTFGTSSYELVRVEGWLDDALQFTHQMPSTNGGFEAITTGAGHFINELRFIDGDGVAFDNFNVVVAPEPTSLAALAGGLLLVGRGRPRRSREACPPIHVARNRLG